MWTHKIIAGPLKFWSFESREAFAPKSNANIAHFSGQSYSLRLGGGLQYVPIYQKINTRSTGDLSA